MRYLIKPAVIVLLSALCTAFIKGYSAYMKKRRDESRDLYRLMETVRRGMSTRLSTPKEALASVSAESPEAERFRALVVSGRTLFEAFCEVSGSLSLSRGCRMMLTEYFKSFGKGYLDEEIRCADELLSRFASEIGMEEERGANDERVVKSVAVAITLGIIIFII